MKTKSGKQVFPIGIGTWGIAGDYKKDLAAKYIGAEPTYGNEEDEIEAIRYAISKGQNHIDCAEMYGAFYTDEVVGKALVGQKREDLFIADKLWKTSLESGKVRPIVEKMLKKLGVDYLDMLYIHAPFDEVNWEEAIPQIDELTDEGIVLNFGVSNFSIEQMQKAMSLTKHSLAANQMNYNVLYKDEVNQAFLDFCKQNGIELIAYQPIKRQEVLKNEVIKKIAKAHDCSEAQAALAWLIDKGTVPIPKAVQKNHIDDNLGAMDVKLSREEVAELDSL